MTKLFPSGRQLPLASFYFKLTYWKGVLLSILNIFAVKTQCNFSQVGVNETTSIFMSRSSLDPQILPCGIMRTGICLSIRKSVVTLGTCSKQCEVTLV